MTCISPELLLFFVSVAVLLTASIQGLRSNAKSKMHVVVSPLLYQVNMSIGSV